MATYREQDPLSTLLMREQARVLECLKQFGDGVGAPAIREARRILQALAHTEKTVLYPAFSRVTLKLEVERLLEDSRDARDQQLAALDALAHKRAARLRKLGAVALSDTIAHHGQQHTQILIPVLASQLPRPLYRSICHAFEAHYEGRPPQAPKPREQRVAA